MATKVLILMCCMVASNAGILGTDNSQTSTSESSIYSSLNETPAATKTITTSINENTINTPAPVYENTVFTHETRTKTLDTVKQNTYSKSLDTNVKNVAPQTTNNAGLLNHSSPPFYSSAPTNSISENSPISQTTSTYLPNISPSPFLTKTVSAPVSTYYDTTPVVPRPHYVPSFTPLYTKSGYTSEATFLDSPYKPTFTYSDAPVVSHMTFTGFGTSYTW